MPSANVSDSFIAAMGAGANNGVVVSAGVYEMGAPVPGYQGLPVESLSITADRQSAQRTTISVVLTPVPSRAYWPAPSDMASPLAPNGNELAVQAGFAYNDGTTELCPIGIFPIVSVDLAAANGNLTITVSADDRSWSISRRGLLQPYLVPTDNYGNPTSTTDVAINTLLAANTSGLPPIQYAITPTTNLAPATTYDQGQDPWAASTDMASGEGYELFVNPAGNVECYPLPDPSQQATPDWVFVSPPDGVGIPIIAATRTLTGDGVTNDSYVVTSTDAAPQQFREFDGNLASPTYIGGKYGDIPNFVQSSVSYTLAAAQLEATYDLLMSLGQVDMLSLQAVANSAVLIDDVCQVTCAQVGLNGAMYVVDGFSTNFATNGAQCITTYTLRRVIANSSSGQQVPVPNPLGSGYYN